MKRDAAPIKGKWYFDSDTGESVTILFVNDDKHWWKQKDGTEFWCDPFDWYIWGRFK